MTTITWSRHIYMGIVLRAHPVRGEPRIQRNASGEVATSLYEFEYRVATASKNVFGEIRKK